MWPRSPGRNLGGSKTDLSNYGEVEHEGETLSRKKFYFGRSVYQAREEHSEDAPEGRAAAPLSPEDLD